MTITAVKLGYAAFYCGVHTNENTSTSPILDCKGLGYKSVYLKTAYLVVIYGFSLCKVLRALISNCAHICSKTRAKEGIAGGKIGVRPRLKLSLQRTRNICASKVIVSHIFENLNSKINHQDEGSSCKNKKVFKA